MTGVQTCALPIYEAIELALLFNMYSRQDWSVELLYPYVKKKTKNENLLFLFVETYAASGRGKLPQNEWQSYLKKANTLNPGRFFLWIDVENYQLLRDDNIKKEFCETKTN